MNFCFQFISSQLPLREPKSFYSRDIKYAAQRKMQGPHSAAITYLVVHRLEKFLIGRSSLNALKQKLHTFDDSHLVEDTA